MNDHLATYKYKRNYNQMKLLHDDESIYGKSYVTTSSSIIDQVPLPFIPGLTVTKRPPKKYFMPEHFHKNVSLNLRIHFYTKDAVIGL